MEPTKGDPLQGDALLLPPSRPSAGKSGALAQPARSIRGLPADDEADRPPQAHEAMTSLPTILHKIINNEGLPDDDGAGYRY